MSTWRDSPSGSGRDPARVSEPLDRVARHLGAPPSAVTAAIFTRWESLVGPEIAAHARPRTLRGGVLVIVADHPVWASQLRFLGGELLRRLQPVAGPAAVTEVQIRVAQEGRFPRS